MGWQIPSPRTDRPPSSPPLPLDPLRLKAFDGWILGMEVEALDKAIHASPCCDLCPFAIYQHRPLSSPMHVSPPLSPHTPSLPASTALSSVPSLTLDCDAAHLLAFLYDVTTRTTIFASPGIRTLWVVGRRAGPSLLLLLHTKMGFYHGGTWCMGSSRGCKRAHGSADLTTGHLPSEEGLRMTSMNSRA